MNKWWFYCSFAGIVFSVAVIVIAGLTSADSFAPAPVYDETWCETMMTTAHTNWQENDYAAFSENCL